MTFPGLNSLFFDILKKKFGQFLWFSAFHQVHHGGAGTTAAGLKAAVIVSYPLLCLSASNSDLVFA